MVIIVIPVGSEVPGVETGRLELQIIQNDPHDFIFFQQFDRLLYGLPGCYPRPDHKQDAVDDLIEDIGLRGGQNRRRVQDDVPVFVPCPQFLDHRVHLVGADKLHGIVLGGAAAEKGELIDLCFDQQFRQFRPRQEVVR